MVLLTTGGDELEARRRLGRRQVRLLRKPFSAAELRGAAEEALAGKPNAAPPASHGRDARPPAPRSHGVWALAAAAVHHRLKMPPPPYLLLLARRISAS